MKALTLLLVCSHLNSLPAVAGGHNHDGHTVLAANNLNKVIHNHSPKLYGHANRLPERAELNKGAVL